MSGGELTRFSPSPNGRMHLGHLWCAFLNWALGDSQGIILRFEDLTVRRTNDTTEVELAAYMQDFRDNLNRFGIPIMQEFRQVEREARYDEINRERFSGILRWTVGAEENKYTHDNPGVGFNRTSAGMAMLSRVVDDHDFHITRVVRGEELQWERPLYTWFYKLAFPDDYERTMPLQRYICDVMEWCDDGTERKMSKSITRSTFLSDLDLDPWLTLRMLAMTQMRESIVSGPIRQAKTLDALRQWAVLATPVKDPGGISPKEIKEWS